MKITRGLSAAAVALVCLVSLTGCLGIGGAARNPAKSAENFLHAIAKQDAETSCTLMADEETGPAKKGTADWTTCVGSMNEMFGASGDDDLQKYGHAKVKTAEIDGDKATVESKDVSGVLDPDIDLTLQRFDKLWYITDLGGDD